jgi:hypothetical protein
LTLLYGPSGVGKTSLLQAGLLHSLRSRDDVVAILVRGWHGLTPLALLDKVSPLEQHRVDGAGTFAGALANVAATSRNRVMLILDQFEQFFVDEPDADVEGQLVEAIAHPHALVSIVLSLREDALARLDRFEGRVPDLFENYLRVDHLTRTDAREAIVGPLEEYERRFGIRVDAGPALIEAVLDDLESEESRGSAFGRGAAAGPGRIQTAYLQLVMSRLWDETRRAGATTIEPASFENLGRSREIFFAHFDGVLGTLEEHEQDVLSRAFEYLVTPTGWKVTLPLTDLATYAKVEPDVLAPILDRLAGEDARILRVVPLARRDDAAYEIFHDVLAEAILEWRGRRERRQLQAHYTIEYGATFSELLLAHEKWRREIADDGAATAETEARYRSVLAGFESAHGRIIQAYWGESENGAIVLTESAEAKRFGRTRRRHRLYRAAGDRPDAPDVAELLARGDELAVRATELLEGVGAEITLQWILSMQSHLIAVLDREIGEDERAAILNSERGELAKIDMYIGRVADNSARQVYVWGVAWGVLAVAVVLAAAAAVGIAVGAGRGVAEDFIVAGLAGALGATVSVLSRMAGDSFELDHDLERDTIRRLGLYRPIVGAAFGIAVYAAALGLASDVAGERYKFVFFAFLAGFAERYTRVIVSATPSTLAADPSGERADTEQRS